MAKLPLVRKKCQRCGAIGLVRTRQRVCYRKRPNPSPYRCNGKLHPTVPLANGVARRVPPVPPTTDEGKRAAFRARVEAKLEHARKKHEQWARRTVRAQNRLSLYERQIAKFERRAQWTDEQIDAQRERMKIAARVKNARAKLARAAGVPVMVPAKGAAS